MKRISGWFVCNNDQSPKLREIGYLKELDKQEKIVCLNDLSQNTDVNLPKLLSCS